LKEFFPAEPISHETMEEQEESVPKSLAPLLGIMYNQEYPAQRVVNPFANPYATLYAQATPT